MLYPIKRFTTLVVPLGAALLLGPWAGGAAAQVVADDVDCSQCVGKGDIADKAVTARKIKSNSIFSPKIVNRSIQGVDIGLGAVGTDELADGGVTFAKLDSDTQMRVEDLEEQVGDITDPPACTNQTLNGSWQAYALHADENAFRAGWERCEFTVSNNSVTAGGSCTNQLGDTFSIVSGGFTMTAQCVATGSLNFSGVFGSASVVHARLDRSRNLLSGVGSATDVGPLAVTVLRK